MNSPIVLIVHPGTIGDVLLATEAIRAVRRGFPSHQLMWVGQSEIGKFLLNAGEVNEIISLEGPFFSKLLSPSEFFNDQMKAILERCTHCICWLKSPNEILSYNLTTYGIQHILQSPHSRAFGECHYEERYLSTLEPWGIQAPEERSNWPLFTGIPFQLKSDYLNNNAAFFESSFIVFHPGSGSLHKCVNSSLLGKIAQRLFSRQRQSLVVLHGPGDDDQVEKFLHKVHGLPYQLVCNHSLSDVAMVLKKADLYIGHDSGMSHLAAGVGTPSIVLFGPTNSDYWGPRGDHVTVIQGPTCQCPDWSQVQQCESKPCLQLPEDWVLQCTERVLSNKLRPPIRGLKPQIGFEEETSLSPWKQRTSA